MVCYVKIQTLVFFCPVWFSPCQLHFPAAFCFISVFLLVLSSIMQTLPLVQSYHFTTKFEKHKIVIIDLSYVMFDCHVLYVFLRFSQLPVGTWVPVDIFLLFFIWLWHNQVKMIMM